MSDEMKIFFIVGTGRCGTTITKRALANHSEVFSFDHEAWFINGPHGVLSLLNSLTTAWSPWQVDTALRDFERLITKKKSKFLSVIFKWLIPLQGNRHLFSIVSPPPYMSVDIRDHSKIVTKHLVALKEDLKVISYNGCWPGMPGLIFNPKITVTTVNDEISVVRALSKFLRGVFKELMAQKRGTVWIDDTVTAHLRALEILKIFPNAKFIYLYRDPRDVIASYMTRLWSPPTSIQSAKLYSAMIDRWNQIKGKLPKEVYLEVCFEELMDNPRIWFKRMCDFMEIPWSEAILSTDLSRSNIGRWKRDLTRDDLNVLEVFAGRYLDMLGYRFSGKKDDMPGKEPVMVENQNSAAQL